MESIVLSVFCICLFLCIALDWSILVALGIGLMLFLLHGRYKGFAWGQLLKMGVTGVKTVKNILIAFVLIGMLTALWRDAGTISVIVSYAAALIHPASFLTMTFLLNCGVSVLTGTAFGTAATMGVICATMGMAIGVEPALVGGAVLGGCYFGDRCSPVSTSALLVSELTETNIFQNIKNMIGTAAVPFLATCAGYTGIGLYIRPQGTAPDLSGIFAREFELSWVALLPAVVILSLSLLQVGVKKAMAASIITALPISLLVQGTSLAELPRLLLMGYQASDAEVAGMLNGGGILSMARVAAIVSIASSYSGIFRETGLLDGAKGAIEQLTRRTGKYTAILVTSVLASMVACNQSLAILLTHQLCQETEPDREDLALCLEDTAVVVAPLVPWSIAGGVPLATVGAPTTSLAFTFFLYLLPLWRLTAGKKGTR